MFTEVPLALVIIINVIDIGAAIILGVMVAILLDGTYKNDGELNKVDYSAANSVGCVALIYLVVRAIMSLVYLWGLCGKLY